MSKATKQAKHQRRVAPKTRSRAHKRLKGFTYSGRRAQIFEGLGSSMLCPVCKNVEVI